MVLNKKKMSLILIVVIIVGGFLIPENTTIPVKGARHSDWNNKSFWYEPWGKSGVHKGIDIFGKKGQELNSSCNGIVIYTGSNSLGGNIVIVLGPKWRFHYYAHLKSTSTSALSFISSGDLIGTVGDSGNAKGKQPHIHYSIITALPYVWRIDSASQGWKKMFYLNPDIILRD